MPIAISPSILNSDITALGQQIDSIRNADWVHVDVMDNHFVPNLTWGLPVAAAVAQLPGPPVDAHLMIMNPDRWAPAYAEAGCGSVTFHIEAAQSPLRLAKEIHRLGARAAVAINPATPIESITSILAAFDMVLVMTVEPGFGGQPFLGSMLQKVRALRELSRAGDLQLSIQVDGGVNAANIAECAEAGADNFVAGSAVFNAEDALMQVTTLRDIANAHCCHA